MGIRNKLYSKLYLLLNTESSLGGNDFALDDISSSTLTPITFGVDPAGNTPSVCEGYSFTLSSNVTGISTPFTFQWAGPNSYTSNEADITLENVTTANSGYYYLTVTDGHGCKSTGITSIIVKPAPNLTYS